MWRKITGTFIVCCLILALSIVPAFADYQAPIVLSDNLALEDVFFRYIEGEDPMRPHSVGLLSIPVSVKGPSSIANVMITVWTGAAQPTAAEAKQEAEYMVSVWREQGYTKWERKTPPFQTGFARPVVPPESGRTEYFIIVGEDKDANYAGYAVIKVDVPGERIETTLNLPANLREIEEEAFAGSSFFSVLMSENTASIGSRAFADCDGLAYVQIPNAAARIATDAFDGTSGVTIIGNSGSTAQDYAREHGMTFIVIS